MQKNTEIPFTRILGIRVDKIDLQGTLDRIDDYIRERKTCQIVVVNAAKVVKAQKDAYLKKIIEEADLSGADGVPIVWVSRLFGDPIPGRVNGTDLMEKLVEKAAHKGYRIFFFGAEEAVVKKVVDIYRKQYPTLQVAGYRNGYFSEHEEGGKLPGRSVSPGQTSYLWHLVLPRKNILFVITGKKWESR